MVKNGLDTRSHHRQHASRAFSKMRLPPLLLFDMIVYRIAPPFIAVYASDPFTKTLPFVHSKDVADIIVNITAPQLVANCSLLNSLPSPVIRPTLFYDSAHCSVYCQRLCPEFSH